MAREPIIRIIPPIAEPIGAVTGAQVVLTESWRAYFEAIERQMGGEGVDAIAAQEAATADTAQDVASVGAAVQSTQDGVQAAQTAAEAAQATADAGLLAANGAASDVQNLQTSVGQTNTDLTALTARIDSYDGNGPIPA